MFWPVLTVLVPNFQDLLGMFHCWCFENILESSHVRSILGYHLDPKGHEGMAANCDLETGEESAGNHYGFTMVLMAFDGKRHDSRNNTHFMIWWDMLIRYFVNPSQWIQNMNPDVHGPLWQDTGALRFYPHTQRSHGKMSNPELEVLGFREIGIKAIELVS